MDLTIFGVCILFLAVYWPKKHKKGKNCVEFSSLRSINISKFQKISSNSLNFDNVQFTFGKFWLFFCQIGKKNAKIKNKLYGEFSLMESIYIRNLKKNIEWFPRYCVTNRQTNGSVCNQGPI